MSGTHAYQPGRKEQALAFARAMPRESTRLNCPHCETPALIRTSVQITVLTRETTYCCVNPECGHTFCALTEIVRTLSPSATPNPSINLPLSTHVRRDLMRATLDHAQHSPYSPRTTRPVTLDMFEARPPHPE
ncbi:ogr/Delta-like zinc finger family protein [Acidovorax sp. SRB_24]|uniref:ogr/Delta-like zinc finger family protein n=1 Tax=Acidovorax sp. SRB_24 TaxID=1962700 RepID=UPI00198083FA|nr:ogr/Delta-like zinc finger family protein [Acidovorax sp. SRB_24]